MVRALLGHFETNNKTALRNGIMKRYYEMALRRSTTKRHYETNHWCTDGIMAIGIVRSLLDATSQEDVIYTESMQAIAQEFLSGRLLRQWLFKGSFQERSLRQWLFNRSFLQDYCDSGCSTDPLRKIIATVAAELETPQKGEENNFVPGVAAGNQVGTIFIVSSTS